MSNNVSSILKQGLRIGERLRESKLVSRYQIRQALSQQKKDPQKLGYLLRNWGLLPSSASPKESELKSSPRCICFQSTQSSRLGNILLQHQWISAEQLEIALQEQSSSEEELGTILIQKGWLDPFCLEKALTQLLLERGYFRRQKLGDILCHTHQISDWQLKQALQSQNQGEQLGQTLLRLKWLGPKQVAQALRLQKKLLRTLSSVVLGSSLLMACQAPTVPLQIPEAGNLNQPPVYMVQSQANLNGAFKTLNVANASEHGFKIRVYQNGSKLIENVPFFRQGSDNTCGQAVISMVVNFWGIKTDYQTLVDQENRFNLATSAGMLSSSLRKKGLVAQDFRKGTLTNLLDEVNQGRPTIVLLDFGNVQSAHYVVVLGYNSKKGTLIMHDSLEGPYVEMDQAVFLKMWENKAVRGILPVGGDNYQRLMFRAFHQDPQS